MSHFTTIKTQIRDIGALRAACEELKFPLLTNTSARGYVGQTLKGEFVIKLNGPYDVAVNSQPDGSFGLSSDEWHSHVERELGKDYGKLLQLYGVHKATLEARKKGLSVQRRAQPNGSIKLVLMGGAL